MSDENEHNKETTTYTQVIIDYFNEIKCCRLNDANPKHMLNY